MQKPSDVQKSRIASVVRITPLENAGYIKRALAPSDNALMTQRLLTLNVARLSPNNDIDDKAAVIDMLGL